MAQLQTPAWLTLDVTCTHANKYQTDTLSYGQMMLHNKTDKQTNKKQNKTHLNTILVFNFRKHLLPSYYQLILLKTNQVANRSPIAFALI